MARKTLEQAKPELEKTIRAIEGLKSLGIEPTEALLRDYEALKKIVDGNSSQQVVNMLQDKIAPAINAEKNAEFANALAAIIGNGVKVTLKAVKGEDGKVTVSFEAASSGGGQKAGTSTNGGTKASSAFNNYTVIVKGENADYAEKTGNFTTASGAVGFILNGGKNPFNLPAEYGKGNSMVRVLEGLEKNEKFAENFEVSKTYVPVVKKAETTETAPAEAPQA